jgi:hypothetical protein
MDWINVALDMGPIVGSCEQGNDILGSFGFENKLIGKLFRNKND